MSTSVENNHTDINNPGGINSTNCKHTHTYTLYIKT